MVKLGLLPAFDGEYFRQTVTLSFNDSGRFEDRWVWLAVNEKSPCVFTRGIRKVYLPVRHGEGKFMAKSAAVLKRLHRRQQVVVRYCTQASDRPTMAYPDNPNGAVDAIAGICNETGRLFGLMPHRRPTRTTRTTRAGPGRTFPRKGWVSHFSRMRSNSSGATRSSRSPSGSRKRAEEAAEVTEVSRAAEVTHR
jgi:phosphoribosylformylglycinamidine (FGAM) synthase-like amidotransferase family enzyme